MQASDRGGQGGGIMMPVDKSSNRLLLNLFGSLGLFVVMEGISFCLLEQSVIEKVHKIDLMLVVDGDFHVGYTCLDILITPLVTHHFAEGVEHLLQVMGVFLDGGRAQKRQHLTADSGANMENAVAAGSQEILV